MKPPILPLIIMGLGLALGACSDQEPAAVTGVATATEAPAPTVAASDPAPSAPAPADPVPASGGPGVGGTGAVDAGTPREIEWDSLIPDDYRPDKLMAEYKIDELGDDDPRAAELMARLRELWDKAPVRDDLDGAAVRLPGFVVPVEADEKETTGFLLVPYYGACIHVPPPPANQTVYVLTEAGKGTRPELFDVVWVTGTMSVKRVENDMAEAGYTLYATGVEPYE